MGVERARGGGPRTLAWILKFAVGLLILYVSFGSGKNDEISLLLRPAANKNFDHTPTKDTTVPSWKKVFATTMFHVSNNQSLSVALLS